MAAPTVIKTQRLPSASGTGKATSKAESTSLAAIAKQRKPPTGIPTKPNNTDPIETSLRNRDPKKPPMAVTPKPADPIGNSLAIRMKRGKIDAVVNDNRSGPLKQPVFKLRQKGLILKFPSSKK